jgi:hypothetical protein
MALYVGVKNYVSLIEGVTIRCTARKWRRLHYYHNVMLVSCDYGESDQICFEL